MPRRMRAQREQGVLLFALLKDEGAQICLSNNIGNGKAVAQALDLGVNPPAPHPKQGLGR